MEPGRTTLASPDRRHGRTLRFGSFELDIPGGRLLRDGRPLAVRPKVWSALVLLATSGGRVIPRQEFFDVLWHDTTVSDAALTSVLRDLRRLLGRDEERGPYFEALRGRGVRFLFPVSPVDVGIVDVGSTGEPARPSGDAFVGRSEPLERSLRSAELARAGRGQVLLLPGAPGMGKTRTSLEVARALEARGFVSHLGRCLEEEGAPAYWPFIQILRECAPDGGPEALPDAIRSLIAEGSEAERALDAPATGDDYRFRIYDAVTRALRAAAALRPRLLVIDDLHRIDAASLALLRHLVPQLVAERILLLATYRDTELDPEGALSAALIELAPRAETLELKRLDPEDVEALSSALAGRDLSPELARVIAERTGGNPLYIREVTFALTSEGALDSPDLLAQASVISPEGLRGVIRGHLSRLPASARELLDVASVIGREVDLGLLGRACQPLASNELRVAVSAALDAQLLVESARWPGRLHFTHILVRDALYDALPVMRRTELHATVGRAIEARWPLERAAHVEALAHHFFKAAGDGESERALEYSRLAADRCLAHSAYESAARLFENALYALELLSAERGSDLVLASGRTQAMRLRAELLAGLGRARWSGGDTITAREHFQAAADAARSVEAAEVFARAALGYTGRSDATQGVNQVAVSLLDEALERLPSEDCALRAECMGRLATELYYSEIEPEAQAAERLEESGMAGSRRDVLSREAVARAERLGDDALLVYTLSCRHYVLLEVDVEPERRARISARMAELARRSDVGDAAALGGAQRVVDLFELADLAGADAALREFAGVCEKLQQPFFNWRLSMLKYLRTMIDGRLDEAERLAHETLAIGQSFGTENATILFTGQVFMISLERGSLGELEAMARRMLDEAPSLPVIRTTIPLILLAAGREQAARDAFGQVAARDFAGLPVDQNWFSGMTNLARACVALRDSVRAERLYERLLPFAGRVIVVAHGAGCAGAVDHFLGVLAACMGDLETAEEHLEEAVAINRRLGGRLLLAHSRRELAAVLCKGGMPRSRDRAKAIGAEAAEVYQDLGLDDRAEEVIDTLRSS